MSPDYKEAMYQCAMNGKFLSVWTLSAASVMLNTRIVSVYPPVNCLVDKNISILNTTFAPQKGGSPRAPLAVMWSSVTPLSSETWTPNHFVPVLLKEQPTTIDLRSPSKKTYAAAAHRPTTISTPKRRVRKYGIFIYSLKFFLKTTT